jgi:hypothetical protein
MEIKTDILLFVGAAETKMSTEPGNGNSTDPKS